MAQVPYNAEVIMELAKKLALEAKHQYEEEPYIFSPDEEMQAKANYFYQIGKVAQLADYNNQPVYLNFKEIERLELLMPADKDGF